MVIDLNKNRTFWLRELNYHYNKKAVLTFQDCFFIINTVEVKSIYPTSNTLILKIYCISAKRIYLFEIKRVRRITLFLGNELATVLIAVVCIALLVWETLTVQRYEKYSDWKDHSKNYFSQNIEHSSLCSLGWKQLTNKEATVKATPTPTTPAHP